MEEDVITLGSLFKYKYSGETPDGKLKGHFEATPSRPRFLSQIAYYGLADDFREALNAGPDEGWE
jgi:pilus assembly protein CpaF